jgi:hypothetical protein
VNLILERERSLLEREAAAEALRAANKEGCDPKEWPPMLPLRGLSNEAAGKIISAINAFIISRRFQDEVAEKRRADDLENRLNEALELVERSPPKGSVSNGSSSALTIATFRVGYQRGDLREGRHLGEHDGTAVSRTNARARGRRGESLLLSRRMSMHRPT